VTSGIDRDPDHLGDPIEVGVAREQDRAPAPGDCGDHAVDDPPRRDPGGAAATIDSAASRRGRRWIRPHARL